MKPTFPQVTVVLQGPVTTTDADPNRPSLPRVVASIRTHLPGAPIVLATWDEDDRPAYPVDEVVWLADPGPLPALKNHPPAPNNVNRQILSTREGLRRVKTPYAVKMRTDCLLTSHAFVDLQRAFPARDEAFRLFDERVVVSSLYTINPRVIERLPFHVSDWFQFGRTNDLTALWDQPFMTAADATWFASRPHRPGTRPLEAKFLSRYAVEQYVFMSCVKTKFRVGCQSVDDALAQDVDLYERLIANNLVLDLPARLGFEFPKNAWASRSRFHKFNCLNFDDWLDLYARYSGVARAPRPWARFARRRAVHLVAALVALQSRFSKR